MVITEGSGEAKRTWRISKKSEAARLVRLLAELHELGFDSVQAALDGARREAAIGSLRARHVARAQQQAALAERNDVKHIYRLASDQQRELLRVVANADEGIDLDEICGQLNEPWVRIRGMVGGLTRIAQSHGFELPIRRAGYRRGNKRYFMDPDARKTVLGLARRSARE
jgi:hypothetical protein